MHRTHVFDDIVFLSVVVDGDVANAFLISQNCEYEEAALQRLRAARRSNRERHVHVSLSRPRRKTSRINEDLGGEK